MKKLFAGLLALLVAAPPIAAGEAESVTLTFHRDTDVTSVEYCSAVGSQGVWGTSGKPGAGQIESSGSSATWTSVDTEAVFVNGIAAGDYLVARPPGDFNHLDAVLAVIVSVDSTSQITVGTAADISAGSGYTWEWWDVTCGSAADSGTYDVSGWSSALLTYDINQLNVTGGIDLRPECRVDAKGADWVVVTDDGAEDAVTAVGTGSYAIVLSEAGFSECRFGHYIDSADDGGDTGSNAEQITLTITRWKH